MCTVPYVAYHICQCDSPERK